MMTILRSLGAVIAGFALMTALVIGGTFVATLVLSAPEAAPSGPYLVVNLLVSFGAAVAGGALTARLAPVRPALHAGAIAVVMVAMTLPSPGGPDAAGTAGRPEWYPLVVLLTGLVGLGVGVWLAGRGRQDGSAGRTPPPRR